MCRNAFPLGKVSVAPTTDDEGKPSGNFPQMGFDRKVCLISRLRAAASPEGEALGGYYYALPHFR